MRLIFATSRPTHTHAPFFRALSEVKGVDLTVCFSWPAARRYDEGFGLAVDWGVSTTDGYDWTSLLAQEEVAHRGRRLVARSGQKTLNSVPTFRQAAASGAAIERLLKETQPHFVVGHGYNDPVILRLAASARRRGATTAIRGTLEPFGQCSWYWRGLRSARIRAALKAYHFGLAIGVRSQMFFERYRLPYLADMGYPAPLDSASVDIQDRRLARQRLGLDPDTPVVGFVGKLQEWKRPRDIVDAVGLTQQDCQVLLVGDGPLLSEIKRSAADRTILAGFIQPTELQSYYNAMDILVLPSEKETWGLVVHESLAQGVIPIVSDRVGCGPDLVAGLGAIYPVGNLSALAASIDERLAAVAAEPLLRDVARLRSEHYSIDRSARKLADGLTRWAETWAD